VDNLVLGSCGHTSSLHVDSDGQHWWRSPTTVDHLSADGIDCVGAIQVLEILCLVSSLGISRISGVRSKERKGFGASSVDADNGDSIGGAGSETGQIHSGVIDGDRDGRAACGCVCNDPARAPFCGIAPRQTQIVDVVGVIRSEGTAGIAIGEKGWCCWNWCADGVRDRSR